MNQRPSPFTIDLLVHALFLAVQLLVLIPGGFLQKGATPPLVYPCWLILSTITVYRQSERLEEYGTRLILVPSILSCLLIGFCLINEMTRDLWAFAQPRHFPAFVRILWYQTSLLLLHPQTFVCVWGASKKMLARLRERGYFGRKILVIAIAVAVVMWLLRSQNISPDGYDWLKHSPALKNWTRYLREPLGMFIFSLFVRSCQALFNWQPYVSLTILTIICGVLATLVMRPVFRYAVPEPFAGLSLLLLLSSYGYSQIFVGNIEIYALLHLGLACFLYCAVRYLKGEWSAWAPGLAFGVLFCTHLSTGWWLPAFFTLPFLKRRVQNGNGASISDLIRMICASAALMIPFAIFVLMFGYDGDFHALWSHFWGDEVMLTGTDRSMFRKPQAFVNFDVHLAMFNEYSCMFVGGALLLAALAFARFRVKEWTPFCLWTALMMGAYLIYSVVWNPDRHFPADWDLFSGLTIPMILLISQCVSRLPLRRETIVYLYYQAVVFSGCYLLIQLLRNHFRITEWPMDL